MHTHPTHALTRVVDPQNVHIARFLLVATPARRKRPRDRFKRTEKRAGIDLEPRRRFRRPTSTGFPGDLFCHFAARSSVDVEQSVENLRTSKQHQPPKRSGAEEYRRRERRRPRKTFSIIRSSKNANHREEEEEKDKSAQKRKVLRRRQRRGKFQAPRDCDSITGTTRKEEERFKVRKSVE